MFTYGLTLRHIKEFFYSFRLFIMSLMMDDVTHWFSIAIHTYSRTIAEYLSGNSDKFAIFVLLCFFQKTLLIKRSEFVDYTSFRGYIFTVRFRSRNHFCRLCLKNFWKWLIQKWFVSWKYLCPFILSCYMWHICPVKQVIREEWAACCIYDDDWIKWRVTVFPRSPQKLCALRLITSWQRQFI